MDVHIPEELALELKKRAEAIGTAAEEVAIQAIKQSLASERRLGELLAPVRTAFARSGMSEEALTELLEDEKHALRRERRVSAE